MKGWMVGEREEGMDGERERKANNPTQNQSVLLIQPPQARGGNKVTGAAQAGKGRL